MAIYILSLFLVLSLLVSQYLSIFVSPVFAASSPWTQTDWVGGSGQTSWSDSTKYSTGTNITDSTAGQLTLSATSGWCNNASCNSSWKYRKKITFNNTDANLGVTSENLVNFPVLVRLSSSNIDYTKTQDSGQDIRFTDTDGSDLAYEIEKWDETGTSWVWVKVPQIDINSNTDYIYLYYGNTSATDHQQASSVWNSNFVMVQHLKETSGTSITDSTSNGNNGTKLSSTEPNPITSGQINGAQTFDGSNDYIQITSLPAAANLTVEVWVNPSISISGEKELFNAKDDSVGFTLLNGKFLFYDSNWFTGTTTVSANTWYYGVITSDGTTKRIYVNAVQENTGSYTRGIASGQARIGTQWSAATRAFPGIIDEVRISNTARSAAWIAASYKTETDAFNTFNSEEERYVSSGTLTSSIFDTEQASNWGTLTYNTDGVATTTVKARTSNSSSMTGATDFSSCNAITSGTDISSNNCVTDTYRYVQYQISLTSASANTPTFQDITITYGRSDSFDLTSPDDNSYTNNERPTFSWKVSSMTGATTTLSSYRLDIDNGSNHLVVSGIAPSSTTDVDTSKYTTHYEGFNDSDSSNNKISVTLKNSADWGSEANQGTLREGKRKWKVVAADTSGSPEESRTLLLDLTAPRLESIQVAKDKISGKITDPLAGGDSSQSQNDMNSKVASGPKSVVVKIEKQNSFGLYDLHTLATVNISDIFWTSDNTKISNNSDNKADKYADFIFTPTEPLSPGKYKITLTAKDKADNTSSETILTLNIITLAQITTPEEKEKLEKEKVNPPSPEGSGEAREELEITKEEAPREPSVFEKATSVIPDLIGNLYRFRVKPAVTMIARGINDAVQGIDHGVQIAFNKSLENVGQAFGFVVKQSQTISIAILNTVNTVTTTVPSTFASITTASLNVVFRAADTVNTSLTIAFATFTTNVNSTLATIPPVKTIVENIYILAVRPSSEFVISTTKTVVTVSDALVSLTTQVGESTQAGIDTIVFIIRVPISIGINSARTITNVVADTSSVIATASEAWQEAISKQVEIATLRLSDSVGSLRVNFLAMTGSAIEDGIVGVTNKTKEGIANATFKIGEKTQDVSNVAGFGIVKFGYLFVNEPTLIADVQESILSPTSVKITWKTNHPANGKVNWGYKDGDYDFEKQSDKRTTYHEFILNDLIPDTEYHYEVISQNKNMVYDANRKFKTPAAK